MGIKEFLVIFLIIIFTSFISYKFGLSQVESTFKTVLEPGSLVTQASYIVFTDGNGNYYAKNGLTGAIEFSGTDASAVIQYAIDSVGQKGGGKILIKDGEYDLTQNPSYPSTALDFKQYDNIVLEGESWNTVLKTNDGDYNAITFRGTDSNPNYGCVIRNLKLDGGATNTTQGTTWNRQNGIMTTGTRDSTFERLYITRFRRTGLYNTQFSHRNLIFNNFLYRNNRYGISYTSSSRGRVIGNYIKENYGMGMNWDATYGENYYTVIEGNVFENNSAVDLYVVGTQSRPPMYGTVTGNTFYSSPSVSQIKMDYAKFITINGNVFYIPTYKAGNRNLYLAWSSNINVIGNTFESKAYKVINLAGSSDNLIEDNTFDTDHVGVATSGAWGNYNSSRNVIKNNLFRGAHGVSIGDNSYNNVIEWNDFRELTGNKISDSGIGTTVKNNYGYITETSGNATIPAGQVNVTVNLPSDWCGLSSYKVILTPTSDIGGKNYWVSSKTPTSFKIIIDSAYTSDITFDWYTKI